MFEYKDDFLMGPKMAQQAEERASYICDAASPADDQLAELTHLVGGDRRLGEQMQEEFDQNPIHVERPPIHEADQLDSAFDAPPRLEFDLEEELARAFDGSEPSTPQRSEPPELSPMHPADEGSTGSALSHLITEQLSRTDADRYQESSQEALSEVFSSHDDDLPPAEASPDHYDVVPVVGSGAAEDGFSQELSRLLGDAETPTEVTSAPPPPSEAFVPYDTATIVDPPEVAQFVVESSEQPEVLEWRQPDETDFRFDTEPSPASHGIVDTPSLAVREASAAQVLARASALREVAEDQIADTPDDEADIDLDLEQALSQELSSAIEDPAFEYQEETSEVAAIAPAVSIDERRKTGWRAAAAIVGVALLGGTAVLAWSGWGGDDAPAPTILAADEPVKVKPDDSGGKVVPNQDQSVYQAVDGNKPDEPVQTKLKETAEKPRAVAKQTTATGPAADQQTTGSPTVKPRRVRTVVVRPDGSIVNSGQTATAVPVKVISPPLAEQIEVAAVEPAPQEPPVPVEQALEEKPVEAQETASESTAEVPEVESGTPIVSGPVTVPTPKPVRVARAEPAPKPAATAPAEPAAPAATATETTTAPAAEPTLPSTSSPFAVQISSQRSAEAAQQSYRELSGRYASIIGGKGVDYKRKVVNGKTYFRVRVPASSRAEAQSMCGQMKATGGDCFVTR